MRWRKGPYSLYGVNIDTGTAFRLEVGSRSAGTCSIATGRAILDVGCGGSYHMRRMNCAGAHLAALGSFCTQLFLCQFEAVRKTCWVYDQRAHRAAAGY